MRERRSFNACSNTHPKASGSACLVDIGLPDLDGYQLARGLKHLPAASNAVLIAQTGYGQAKDKEDALNAGFDRHLTKPVGADTFPLFYRNRNPA